MSFTCQRPFSITINPPIPAGGDMPLDQAIYAAARDKIFACRGPYVYRFSNAGVLEASAKVEAIWGKSCIAYDSLRDILYWAGEWDFGQTWEYAASASCSFKGDINKINPTTLATFGSIAASGGDLTYNRFCGHIGIQFLWYNAKHDRLLYYYGEYDGGFSGWNFANILPTLASNIYSTNPSLPNGQDLAISANLNDVAYDPNNDWIFTAEQDSTIESEKWVPVDGFYENDKWWNAAPLPGAVTDDMRGITCQETTGRMFCVNTSQYIYAFTPFGAAPYGDVGLTQVADLLSGTAEPNRIKWRALDGKLYCPSMENDTVYVVDPLGGGPPYPVVAKTGFDSPFDIVFTATKAFAVQRGSVPLKEIT